MRSLRVLVTGGAGYIGSHTCRLLAEQGHVPVTYDNLTTGHRWAVRWGPFEEGDLADTLRLVRTLTHEKIDAVVHLAGSAYVGESMADPAKYFRNNVLATANLLDAMNTVGVRTFVFSSTCSTYGTPATIPIVEDTPQCPINPYGESKLMVEKMLRWHGDAYGLKWTALRYFNAAGADPSGEIGEVHEPEPHLIPLAIQTALGQRETLAIFGDDYPTPDGTAVRDYVHVTDLADAHIRAIEFLTAGGRPQAMNLATGRGHSVAAVVAAVERVSGRRILTVKAPRRAGDPPVLVADPGRATALLGWRPRHSELDAMVESAVRWHASQAAARGERTAAGPLRAA